MTTKTLISATLTLMLILTSTTALSGDQGDRGNGRHGNKYKQKHAVENYGWKRGARHYNKKHNKKHARRHRDYRQHHAQRHSYKRHQRRHYRGHSRHHYGYYAPRRHHSQLNYSGWYNSPYGYGFSIYYAD